MVSLRPDVLRDSPSSQLERLLRRDRLVTLAGLTALCLLAWGYLFSTAATGMTAWNLAHLTLFPHQLADAGAMASMATAEPMMHWPPSTWVTVAAMWLFMMIAMMTPSAAPTILLYATIYRGHQTQDRNARLAPTGVFTAGYLLAWFGFSLAASGLQWVFTSAGILADATMASRSAFLSAAVLLAAGLYQFSPLKNVCLAQCRDPVGFFTRNWRPGPAGALRLGALHGTFCVGCCWLLMVLLFVGGVMNPVWIAVLAILVLIEKLVPRGRWIGLAAGGVFILWALATIQV
jgi:predicted metal-binding membrane protein